MGKHVDEVVHDRVEIVFQQVFVVFIQRKTLVVREDFVVGKLGVEAAAGDVLAQEVFFVEVFAAFFVVIFPVARVFLLNFAGMQACKDRIPAILRRGGQNAVIMPFALDVVVFGDQRLQVPSIGHGAYSPRE